jgi:hypothetical protein
MILPPLIKELQTLLAIGLVHFECDAVFFIFSLWAAALVRGVVRSRGSTVTQLSGFWSIDFVI